MTVLLAACACTREAAKTPVNFMLDSTALETVTSYDKKEARRYYDTAIRDCDGLAVNASYEQARGCAEITLRALYIAEAYSWSTQTLAEGSVMNHLGASLAALIEGKDKATVQKFLTRALWIGDIYKMDEQNMEYIRGLAREQGVEINDL